MRPDDPPRRPLQSAVALAYRDGEGAPKVVAKGRGLVAEQIIAVAAEAGVYVHESKELVSLLMDIDLDRQIPPALYRVIAELLAWLYHIESAKKTGLPPPPAPPLAVPTPAAPEAAADSSPTTSQEDP
ncbi:flagellar biosynthesis protein [Pseudoduganella lurida]|uniref:Flagellar biosynthesis protein n=1 Tax=Pseudoduganella lurida TaxID=1036180 RepID=A0A562R865_9BURK|nr:EscU/YscU/HrcU family type III secretion system export apparatus switch protein [Pseudoduganella lurida]TWI64600.1 flagellar biosynthesis protein [Pseudoduganella lurida]